MLSVFHSEAVSLSAKQAKFVVCSVDLGGTPHIFAGDSSEPAEQVIHAQSHAILAISYGPVGLRSIVFAVWQNNIVVACDYTSAEGIFGVFVTETDHGADDNTLLNMTNKVCDAYNIQVPQESK